MPLISISSARKKTISSQSNETVEFDGYLNVTPTHSNTITTRPTEEGFDVNDAVHNNPINLAVEIIITDTPQSIIDNRISSSLPAQIGLDTIESFSKRQLDILEKFSNNRESISLTTKYRTYKDYYILNFTYRETSEQALRISFNLLESRKIINGTTANENNKSGVT